MENNIPMVGKWRKHLYLFSISFLSLFMELLLIRWIGTEVRIFAYFRNLILISCFLGLGIGFSLKKFQSGLLTSITLILLLAALVHPSAEFRGFSLRKVPEYLNFQEFHMWSMTGDITFFKVASGFAMIAVVMIILAGIFIPFGQILGRIFEASDNRIRDYSINLLGSLIGTWSFALLSFLSTPPWLWFVIGTVGALYFIRSSPWRTIAGLTAIVLILILAIPREKLGSRTIWSSYQKLTITRELADLAPGVNVPFYSVEVNTVLYMFIFDLSYAQAEKYPGIFNRQDSPYYPYDLPFRLQPNPERVLIVGSGGGNDAAGAVRNNAGEIDAVEIDPVIAELGRTNHPEHPYQDLRVHLVVNDARSFLKRTDQKYNLIIFGLLDSHTLTSNFTNINLDSYVYTLESIRDAKSLLAPGGIIALCFQTGREWMGYKLYAMIEQVFGRPPIIINNHSQSKIQGSGGTLFITGDLDGVVNRIQKDPELSTRLAAKVIPPGEYRQKVMNAKFDVPEDDWPYLYLQRKTIPGIHIIMTMVIIALMAAAVLFLFPGRKIGPSHFLFLGAGFMLIEVHSISKAALLFGSTWIVNAVIISSVLVMILVSNLLVLRYRIERLRYWYAGLFVSLALAYFIPVSSFIWGGYLARGILAGSFYSLPLFFAGVIFASSINRVAGIDAAFSANMLGAAVGGMLESASFIFGLRAVVLIAIALYAASALAMRGMPLKSNSDAG
jgi:hypothetical protein